jgi:hypothetical protein
VNFLRRQAFSAGSAGRVLLLGILVSALGAQVAETRRPIGIPEDWSHHHIVFRRSALASHPEVAGREPRVTHRMWREMATLLRYRNPISSTLGSQNSRDWSVSLGTGRVLTGSFPAKYGFSIISTPSCSRDYAVFGLFLNAANTPGVAGGQANLVAYNNLYSGAGGPCTGPTTLFSYNVTTVAGGQVRTSPVLSADGKKIAFVESNNAGGSALFHVLTWASGAGNGVSATNSAVPGAGNSASMTSLTYAASGNTRSSPWIDYATDSVYVGANNGSVYKINNVFFGTPTLAGAPWPVALSPGRVLSSPVLDNGTGNLFVGDTRGSLFQINTTTGAFKSLAVGQAGSPNAAIVDAPIVDPSSGTVFATSSNDGTSAVVVEADTTTLAQLARGRIGQGSTAGAAVVLYDGAFDNNYENGLSSGFLFSVGTGAADTSPWIYQFGFTGRTMNTPAASSTQIVTSVRPRVSPVTEFFNPNINGGTDFFFFSLSQDCPAFGNSGCVMSRTSGGTVVHLTEAGGTSGIVIDNDNTGPQTSDIYFTNTAAPFSAVKLTQNGLN